MADLELCIARLFVSDSTDWPQRTGGRERWEKSRGRSEMMPR